MNDNSNRDFTVMEVCEQIKTTPPTVYKLLREGKLDSYKVGRSRRVTHESIARLRQGKAAA